MTLPRIIAMNKHWAQFPPVHIGLNVFMKAFLGTGKEQAKQGNIDDLMRAFGAAGGKIKRGR